MPVRYSDYKIKCPFYGSTRGLKIVCHNGYSYEFKNGILMEKWKQENCMRLESCSCDAKKLLLKEALGKRGNK